MRTSHQEIRSGGRLALVAAAVMTAILATAAGAQPSGALSTVRAQKIANQTIGSFPVQQNDHFGATFAVGDFNGDGRDDLATGVPDDDGPTTAPVSDGGAFIVLVFAVFGWAHDRGISRYDTYARRRGKVGVVDKDAPVHLDAGQHMQVIGRQVHHGSVLATDVFL